MKTSLVAFLTLFLSISCMAQPSEDFYIEVEEVTLANSPGVQSFTYAKHDGKWLIIGGRTDGLHQRQPFAAFQPADNNLDVYVIDPDANTTVSASLTSLPTSMVEQLQSTNMEFEQVGSTLYITGGYGYSNTASDHITYPYLTAVDVPSLMTAVINGTSITSSFRQIQDARVQVTGGVLDKIGNTFYLAGGQMFEGAYNPMGPDHGPGFVQEYTNAIRTFEISDDGTNMSIVNYVEWLDTVNLHRRDYNMVPQIFPSGQTGLTMFSGVFQYNLDLPWLNTVDVMDTGYAVVPNFNQYLNQYHNAKMPVYDVNNNAMHTVFFGGISRYTMDNAGQLVDDQDVPFVKTISKVTRYNDGTMAEFKSGEMPGLLGSGAEFIHIDDTTYFDSNEILHLEELPYQRTLVGYIIGGIESTQPNIFFINDGTQSDATTRVFEVYITRGVNTTEELIQGKQFFTTSLYPNPATTELNVEISAPHTVDAKVILTDLQGKVVRELYNGKVKKKGLKLHVDTSNLSEGTYLIQITSSNFTRTEKFVKVK